MESFTLIHKDDVTRLHERMDEILFLIRRSSQTPFSKLNDRWMSIEEASQVLHCSTRSVHNYIERGYLPHRRTGRRLYFLKEDLETFMAGGNTVYQSTLPSII